MMNLVEVNAIPKAEAVPTDKITEVYNVCLKMADVCKKNHGIGLAAVQVGIPWKLFVIDHKRPRYYVNLSLIHI